MSDVLIFGGQSNMQGQSECRPAAVAATGILEYKYLKNAAVPLCDPAGEDIGERLLAAHEGHGTLLPAFCRAYRRMCGADVLAVHAAKGATKIADWQRTGQRYKTALQKITGGVRFAEENLAGADRIFYIWLQGESDALAGTSEEEYLCRLKEYREALCEDAGIDVFCIIRVGYFTADGINDVAIMRAQDAAARQEGFLMLTDVAARLSKDARFLNPHAAGHFNNRGLRLLGGIAGRALGRYAARLQKS